MAKTSTIVIRLTDEDRKWLEKGAKGRPVSEWAREVLLREAQRVYVSAGDDGWMERLKKANEGKSPSEILESQILGAVDEYLKERGIPGLSATSGVE